MTDATVSLVGKRVVAIGGASGIGFAVAAAISLTSGAAVIAA